MKVKPAKRSGGVTVELARDEALETSGAAQASEPLAIFKLRRILVPVDFSGCSKKALQYAIPFARQFEASLVLLHVVQPYIPVPEMTTVDTSMVEAGMRESGAKALARLKKSIGDKVSVETALRVGSPHFEISKAVPELNIDIIILSTHGRTGLAHVFMGSVAERVVRHASCPVLVVREQEHEFVETHARSSRHSTVAPKRGAETFTLP